MSNGMTYEEYLRERGSLTCRMTGVSMLPLFREGRDVFTVRRKEPSERCRPGDVVLYRRPPGHYVLHRVIRVRDTDYVILGDNCVLRESGIRDGDILGIMTGFIRKGKTHTVREIPYRLYSLLMVRMGWLRVFLKRCRLLAGRIVKKVIHA